MIKKVFCAMICLALCLSMAACTEKKPDDPTGTSQTGIPLTQEERDILDAMGSDVQVIPDDAYIQTVAELMYHTSEYVGKVYQLEGRFSAGGEFGQIYRTLVSESKTMTLGLSLRYLNKDIADGSWIRVTAIVAQGEVDGKAATVLDVVAIEAPQKAGQAELPWDGADIHSH